LCHIPVVKLTVSLASFKWVSYAYPFWVHFLFYFGNQHTQQSMRYHTTFNMVYISDELHGTYYGECMILYQPQPWTHHITKLT